MSDQMWMQYAFNLALKAEQNGEVPIGAVLTCLDELVAEGFNQPILQCDPTAHAEIMVLRLAAKKIKNYRLIDSTLYVTLEPCVMCFAAMVHARIKRLVYACADPKAGAITVFNLDKSTAFNHRFEIVSSILQEECSQILKNFFLKRRG